MDLDIQGGVRGHWDKTNQNLGSNFLEDNLWGSYKSFLYMLNLGIHDTAWFSSDKKLTLVQEEAESRDLYSDLQNI